MAAVLPIYLTFGGTGFYGLSNPAAYEAVRGNSAGTAFELVTIYSRSEADAAFASLASNTFTGSQTVPSGSSFIATNGGDWNGVAITGTGLTGKDTSNNTTWSINSATGVITAVGSGLTTLNGSNISSGTVANARTTATSANTASAIVARDSSGNINVGAIGVNGVVTLNGNSLSGAGGMTTSRNFTHSSNNQTLIDLSANDSTTGTGGVTALKVNLAGTGTGSGTKRLIDLQKAGTSKVFVTSLGSTVFSNAAISTSATDGFIYAPSCAGTPSGTPTTQTGTVATVYDTSANKLWIYNGSWRSVTLA